MEIFHAMGYRAAESGLCHTAPGDNTNCVASRKCAVATRVDVGSGRVRIRLPGLGPEAIEHHLFLVIELNCEPVPSAHRALHLVCEKFVIHPGDAVHGKLGILPLQLTCRAKPGKGDVVRSFAWLRALLADAVLALNDRRFLRL